MFISADHEWLVGCFGFNGPLRQYFSLYRAVSQREGEKLIMKFFLLINVKMPTIVGTLPFICWKNSNLGLNESEKAEVLDIFKLMSI